MRIAGTIAILAAWSAFGQPRPPAPGARGERLEGPLVRVPSKFAGSEGVWVRVAPPSRPRYKDGAPVVVHVPGGMGPGGVGTAQVRLGDFGFVDIVFLFPGGESGPPVDGKPLRSGGVYDSRGPASVRALADVVRFATGRLKSTEGKSIQEYLGGTKVLTGQVGLIGWSLGGTTIAAALGMHGKELRGVAWYASHESPYGEGVINGEFGTAGAPNGFYHATTGKLDLSALKYGRELPVTLMGRPLPGAEHLRGSLYLDGNGNGVYDPDADFAFSGMFLPGPPPNVFFSPSLTRAALEKKVFGGQWPSHIATVKQTEEAWRIRDGVSNIPDAVRNLPQLAVIVFAGEIDHVQRTADHRHILLQYGGWQQAGARWARLNPDAGYVAMVLGRKAADAPQNPAGANFDRQSIRKALMPEPPEGPSDPEALTAAACELADRTNKNDWRPVLDRVLFPEAPRRTRADRDGDAFRSVRATGARAGTWVRPASESEPLVWGRTDGVVFGLASPGGLPGPRGLIRVGIWNEVSGRPELINFIAVEPVTFGPGPRQSRMAFSELEKSQTDGLPGKRFTARTLSATAERLSVRIEVEPFTNNHAHVYVVASMSAERPREIALSVYHHEDSAAIEELTLTATMGNYARLRWLWLKNRVVDSRELYRGYTGQGFADKENYPAGQMLRTRDGDPIVLASTNESDPAVVAIPDHPFWTYRSAKLTQFWRVPSRDAQPDLRVKVNGRGYYYKTDIPIPGGIAFENFELRQRYVPGQVFCFGLLREEPWEIRPAIPFLPPRPEE